MMHKIFSLVGNSRRNFPPISNLSLQVGGGPNFKLPGVPDYLPRGKMCRHIDTWFRTGFLHIPLLRPFIRFPWGSIHFSSPIGEHPWLQTTRINTSRRKASPQQSSLIVLNYQHRVLTCC